MQNQTCLPFSEVGKTGQNFSYAAFQSDVVVTVNKVKNSVESFQRFPVPVSVLVWVPLTPAARLHRAAHCAPLSCCPWLQGSLLPGSRLPVPGVSHRACEGMAWRAERKQSKDEPQGLGAAPSSHWSPMLPPHGHGLQRLARKTCVDCDHQSLVTHTNFIKYILKPKLNLNNNCRTTDFMLTLSNNLEGTFKKCFLLRTGIKESQLLRVI